MTMMRIYKYFQSIISINWIEDRMAQVLEFEAESDKGKVTIFLHHYNLIASES